MSGAFRNRICGPGPNMTRPCPSSSWEAYNLRRIGRLTNQTHDRVAHDYQRILAGQGFAGGVAFVSDQGLFVAPPRNPTRPPYGGVPGDSLQLVSADGDMSNNIALSVAVSEGDGPGKRYLVTTMWDWSPLSSIDSGAHWPSTGLEAGCIGEGGGAFAMGHSNLMFVIHKHNVLRSPHGGRATNESNHMTRFVVPRGGEVGGVTYLKRRGSRTEPAGPVFMVARMVPPPWNGLADKAITCHGEELQADLGPHTNFSCLAAVDLGTSYGWYPGVNYALWRGDGNRHCYICKLAGNSTSWTFADAKGAFSYVSQLAVRNTDIDRYDIDGDGRIDAHDLRATQNEKPEDDDGDDDGGDDGGDDGDDGDDDHDEDRGGAANFVFKSLNFGQNWTWSQLPASHQRISHFFTDPTDSSTLYGLATDCIARSHDLGDSWEPCLATPGLSGSFARLAIKDSKTMIVTRNRDVPLRTTDGGASWQPLPTVGSVHLTQVAYSWSGKTLAYVGTGGSQSATHPHVGYVWTSTDDGDTWKDETGDIVTMSFGTVEGQACTSDRMCHRPHVA